MPKRSSESTPHGQAPMTIWSTIWIIFMVLGWAANSVIVKVTVSGIPPFWAALLRFGIAFPLVTAFIVGVQQTRLRLSGKQFLQYSVLGLLMFTQIALFNIGSQYTTGSRVTMFIFTYPLFVPLMAAVLVKGERLHWYTGLGCVIAFIGIVMPLRNSLLNTSETLTWKGDLIELASALVLSLLLTYMKRLMAKDDIWNIFFWRMATALPLFLLAALSFESFSPADVPLNSWLALAFQSIVVTVVCFLAYQYVLSKHSSSSVSVFFFATPLFGILLDVALLGEVFDPVVLLGCLLVAAGIAAVNWLPRLCAENRKTPEDSQVGNA